jgi:hypothetical protein
MLIAPVVGGTKLWRGSRTVKTDSDGHLKMDGVLPGLTYNVEDERNQEQGGRVRVGAEDDLFNKNVQLLPAE